MMNQFHTASYKGNMPGHDQAYRGDSQNPSSFAGSPAASSQYQGMKRTFQPTGYVQSFYGQNQMQGSAQTQPQIGMGIQNQQSAHLANYRGNQPGHDQTWRSDSMQPSTFRAGTSFQSQNQYQPQYQQLNQYQPQTQMGMGIQNQQSAYLPNYRGNQPGHDQIWRTDSSQPTMPYRQ